MDTPVSCHDLPHCSSQGFLRVCPCPVGSTDLSPLQLKASSLGVIEIVFGKKGDISEENMKKNGRISAKKNISEEYCQSRSWKLEDSSKRPGQAKGHGHGSGTQEPIRAEPSSPSRASHCPERELLIFCPEPLPGSPVQQH